jgi:hypothetical protein
MVVLGLANSRLLQVSRIQAATPNSVAAIKETGCIIERMCRR